MDVSAHSISEVNLQVPRKKNNKHIIQDFDVSAHGISEVNLQSSIGQKAIESVYARFRYAQVSKETSKLTYKGAEETC